MDSFFGIGIFELFLIAVIALVVLGPERLPGAMRTVAGYFRQIRQVSNEFTSQFSEEIKMLDEMNPRRIINDVLDPSKTPSSSPSKPAAKLTTTKPPASSNADKGTAAAATGVKNAAQPLSSEKNTMLPPKDGTASQGATNSETVERTPPPEGSQPAASVKSAAGATAPNSPVADATVPSTGKPTELKAAASAEE